MRVELQRVEEEFKGFVTVEGAVLRFERFSGEMSHEIVRHRYFRGDAVGVLLFDANTRRVLLQRQFRYTAYARTGEGWLVECVAGLMEANESPMEVAVREVREETGLRLKRAELLAHYFISPGGSSDQVYLFLGEVENPEDARGVHGLWEEGEEIQAEWVPVKRALEMIDNGEVKDAKTLIALGLLDRRLRASA